MEYLECVHGWIRGWLIRLTGHRANRISAAGVVELSLCPCYRVGVSEQAAFTLLPLAVVTASLLGIIRLRLTDQRLRVFVLKASWLCLSAALHTIITPAVTEGWFVVFRGRACRTVSEGNFSSGLNFKTPMMLQFYNSWSPPFLLCGQYL